MKQPEWSTLAPQEMKKWSIMLRGKVQKNKDKTETIPMLPMISPKDKFYLEPQVDYGK